MGLIEFVGRAGHVIGSMPKNMKNLTDWNSPPLIKVDGTDYKTNIAREYAYSVFSDSPIIVPAFGMISAIDSRGEYNRVLARAALDAREYCGKKLPIVAQGQVGDYLNKVEKVGDVISISDDDVKRTRGLEYVDTGHFLEEAKEILEKKGIKVEDLLSILTAQPVHAWRAIKIANVLEFCPKVFLPPLGYAPKDSHWQAHNKWAFAFWEAFLARPKMAWDGRI